jgi:hypothetical protein
MRASARPEAVAVLAEGRINNGLQHCSSACWIRRSVTVSGCQARARHSLAWESPPAAPDWAGTSPTTVAPGSPATPYAAARRSGQCPDHPHRLRLWPAPASTPVAGSLLSAPLKVALTLCPLVHVAGDELHRCPSQTRIHRVLPRVALLAQASDAVLATSAWPRTLLLVRPFACGSALQASHRLLRPRLTSRSGSTPSPFRAQGEISPGKTLVSGVTDYALYMLDPTGIVSNGNVGGERIKGDTAVEIVRQHFSRFYTPGDQANGKPARALQTAVDTGHYEEKSIVFVRTARSSGRMSSSIRFAMMPATHWFRQDHLSIQTVSLVCLVGRALDI